MPRPIIDDEEKKEEGLVLNTPSDFLSDAIAHVDNYSYRTPGVNYPNRDDDNSKPLLNEDFLKFLTPKGVKELHQGTNEKQIIDARTKFLNHLKEKLEEKEKSNKIPTYEQHGSREITLEDFIGEDGVELYKKAIIEEMKSTKFRDAIFLKSILTIKGDAGEWDTKRIIWIGAPSGGGKSEGAKDVLTFLASELEKTGNKQEIAVQSDGGIIRETSQMRSIIARLAEKLGYSIITSLHDITDKVFDQRKGTNVRAKVCVAEAAFASNLNIIKSETFNKPCPELEEYEDRIRKGNLNYRQVFVEIKRQTVRKGNIALIEKDLKDNLQNHIAALQRIADQFVENPDLEVQYPDLNEKLKGLTKKLQVLTKQQEQLNQDDKSFKKKLIDDEIKERERRFNDTIYRQANYRAKAKNFDPKYLENYPVALNFPPVGEHKAYKAGPGGIKRYLGTHKTKKSGRKTYEKRYQDDPDKLSITITADTTFVGIVNGEVKEVDRDFKGPDHRTTVRLLYAWNIYWDTLKKDDQEALLNTYNNDKLMILENWEKNLNLEQLKKLKEKIIDVKKTQLSDKMNYTRYLDRLIGFDPHVTIPKNTQLTQELAEYFDDLATYDKSTLRKQIDFDVDLANKHLSPLSLLNYAEKKGFVIEKKPSDYRILIEKDMLDPYEKNQFLSDIKQFLFEQMIERQKEYRKNAFEIKLSLCFKKSRNEEYQLLEGSHIKIKKLLRQYPEYLSSDSHEKMHFALKNQKWLDFRSRPTVSKALQKAFNEASMHTVKEALSSSNPESNPEGVFGYARLTLYKKESHPVERKIPTGVYQLRVTPKKWEEQFPKIATENKNTQPNLESVSEKHISPLNAGEYAINFIENTDKNSKSGYFVEHAAIQANGKIKIQSTAQRLPPEINKTTIFTKALNELCGNHPLLNHHKADLVKMAHKLKLNKDLFNTLKKNNKIDMTGLRSKDNYLLKSLGLNIDTINNTLLNAYYKACGVQVQFNGNTHTLPSPAYLNYAQKQCESLQLGKAGKVIKIRELSNEDPMLIRAYIMVCTAKDWNFKNGSKSVKDNFDEFCKHDFVKKYVMENISNDEPFHKPAPIIMTSN